MGCHRVLFSKLPWKKGIIRKWLTHELPPKATWRSFGLAIPKTGGHGRESCRQKTQDRACQEGQFRQALDTFRVVNELAMGADHLLGTQRDLLNGLIINDKFCMVRTGKLKLNHWRRPLQLRDGREKEYSAHRGKECRGNEEKIVENRTNGAGAPGRTKAVGSGLSVSAGNCTISESQYHSGSSPDGGRPCE